MRSHRGPERHLTVIVGPIDGDLLAIEVRHLLEEVNIGEEQRTVAATVWEWQRAVEAITVREVGADEAGPVLKRYVAVATKTRVQFEATKDSPVEDFVIEAGRHPVFELIPAPAERPTGSGSSEGP